MVWLRADLRVVAVDWPGLGLVTSETSQLGGEPGEGRGETDLVRLLVFRACRATVLARLVVLELIMAGRQLGLDQLLLLCTDRPHSTVSLSHCLTGLHSSLSYSD